METGERIPEWLDWRHGPKWHYARSDAGPVYWVMDEHPYRAYRADGFVPGRPRYTELQPLGHTSLEAAMRSCREDAAIRA